MQVAGLSFWLNGITRMSAPVSSFILDSHCSWPHQPARRNPPLILIIDLKLKIGRCESVLAKKFGCLCKQTFLYLRQKQGRDTYKLLLLSMPFFLCIAPDKFNLTLFDILWSNVDAQRDSFHLPFVKLPTRSVFISVIHVCSYTSAL